MSYSFPRQLAIAADQALNVLCFGWADETLSARAYRGYVNRRRFGLLFMPLIDKLFSWQGDDWEVNKAAGRVIKAHCERAWWKEILRRDNAPEYR
jgi:hypothetical protein